MRGGFASAITAGLVACAVPADDVPTWTPLDPPVGAAGALDDTGEPLPTAAEGCTLEADQARTFSVRPGDWLPDAEVVTPSIGQVRTEWRGVAGLVPRTLEGLRPGQRVAMIATFEPPLDLNRAEGVRYVEIALRGPEDDETPVGAVSPTVHGWVTGGAWRRDASWVDVRLEDDGRDPSALDARIQWWSAVEVSTLPCFGVVLEVPSETAEGTPVSGATLVVDTVTYRVSEVGDHLADDPPLDVEGATDPP